MAAKLQVYDEVVLECTQPWLEAPGALILPNNGRMFEVKVTALLCATHLPSLEQVVASSLSIGCNFDLACCIDVI